MVFHHRSTTFVRNQNRYMNTTMIRTTIIVDVFESIRQSIVIFRCAVVMKILQEEKNVYVYQINFLLSKHTKSSGNSIS